jgi:outer membrane immunogenic protein
MRFLGLLLSGVVLSNISIGTVYAGDWQGTYASLLVAYGAGDQVQYENAGNSPTHDISGLAGGIGIGINIQQDTLVFGAEADVMVSGIDGSFSGSFPPWGCGVPDGCRTEFDWLATLRGRLGYDMGNIMPYVTAGIALANVESSDQISLAAYDMDEKAVGLALGLGLETALTDSWGVKAEGLYVDFGKTKDSVAPTGFGVDTNLFVARLGLNYRF